MGIPEPPTSMHANPLLQRRARMMDGFWVRKPAVVEGFGDEAKVYPMWTLHYERPAGGWGQVMKRGACLAVFKLSALC